jgi:hypothetical protein
MMEKEIEATTGYITNQLQSPNINFPVPNKIEQTKITPINQLINILRKPESLFTSDICDEFNIYIIPLKPVTRNAIISHKFSNSQ